MRRTAARLLRIAGLALAVLVAVAAGCAAFVSSRYFTAAVEAELARTLLETRHRTLKFDGPLEIFFWPNAGFKVGRLSLSEPGTTQEFASLESARFSVAVMPLFHGRIAVDDCTVEGLQASIVRHRDGTLNIDDLFVSEKPSSASFGIDVAGIAARHGTLTWVDEAGGTRTIANDVSLTSGRLQADMAERTLHADDLALAASVGDSRLRLGIAGLAASPAALAADRVALDVAYKAGETAFGVALAAHLAADPAHTSLALESLAGDIDASHPRLAQPVKLKLRGALHAGRLAADGKLAARFDESNASAKFSIARYSPLALHFDIDVDRLDIGRYLAHHAEPAPAAPGKTSSFDLSALKGLEVDGTARIGSLQIAGIRTSNIKLEIRSAQGKLDVRSLGDPAGR